MPNSQLKYRICSVTSESPNYQASNLSLTDKTLGWQSQYSPGYPQSIDLQFFVPIQTKTMKIVFHQYKIPSRVQVFVRVTKKQSFRKLGYLIPNDNSQSNFEHKEIKTLYFEFPCNYIKLVFYQNYRNEMNIFDQVAIQDIIIQGEVLTLSQTRDLDLQDIDTSQEQDNPFDNLNARQISSNNDNSLLQANKKQARKPFTKLENNSSTDELQSQFNEIYNHLEAQKVQAVQHQDFQSAAHIKSTINGFKQLQQDISKLQMQKRHALEEEDFDKCHRIKQEIILKKQKFEYKKHQLFSNQSNYENQHEFSRFHNQNDPIAHKLKNQNEDIRDYFSSTPQRVNLQEQKNFEKSRINDSKQKNLSNINKSIINHDQQIVPALLKKPNRMNTYQNEQQTEYQGFGTGQKTRQDTNNSKIYQKNRRISSPSKLSQVKNLDNSILSKNGQIIQKRKENSSNLIQNTVTQQQQPEIYEQDLTQSQRLYQKYEHFKLQKLDPSVRMKLEHNFSTIRQIYWEMITHKNWKVKKQALQYVNDHVQILNKQHYMAVIEFISFSINDNHTQVLIETLKLLNKLIEQGNFNNVSFSLPHLPYFVQEIMESLLNLLTNTNRQLSEDSSYLYLHLQMIDFLPMYLIISKLVKHKQSTKGDPKAFLTKLNLMHSLIQKYPQAIKYYKDIANWAATYLEDPNNKVKTQAGVLLNIIVDRIGADKVLQSIKSSKLLEVFHAHLDASTIIQDSKIIDQSSRMYINQANQVYGNQSKLNDEKDISLFQGSKSKQKNNSMIKNQSNVSKNKSSVRNESSISGLCQNRLQNPWASPKGQKFNQRVSQNSERQQNMNMELQYSRESSFHQDDSKKVLEYQQNESQHFQKLQEDQIRVLSNADQQSIYEQNICDFCCQSMNGLDQRNHLIRECKVIAYCQQCNGKIYIRQMTDHLLDDCNNRGEHQMCKTCGLSFNIQEINQHVGRGLCRLQRGDGWERCQFCAIDVIANDAKWIQHAFKCPNLPETPITQTQNKTEKDSQDY